ncbi:MAG: metallophosphoesterase [Clostridia bacterium]|nr:metallophosphoesterase [Clostridia bacterium]
MGKELKFNNGKFKIMVLGDIHERLVIESREDELKQRDAHKLFEMGMKAFQPDLVVLLGDTCSEYQECENYTLLHKEALERILKPILKTGVPMCYCLGNHEHDLGHEKEIVEAYSMIENFIGVNDESAPGDFNCNILIKDSKGENDILNLWFIDSNNCAEDREISNYDWVHKDQIEWYEKKAQEIKDSHNGKTIPAILFQHIPVYEEYELFREAKPYEYFWSTPGYIKPYKDKRFIKKEGVEGYLGEGPCSPDINMGQFESWKKVGDIKAAFFGHDHLNDFTGVVDNIILGQNKTSGFHAYTDGCKAAIRMITIDENEPDKINTRIYHFKELGLTSESLGPIEKRINDRTSMNLHKLGYAGAVLAGAVGIGAIIKHFKR